MARLDTVFDGVIHTVTADVSPWQGPLTPGLLPPAHVGGYRPSAVAGKGSQGMRAAF